jgi:hypothetical protein
MALANPLTLLSLSLRSISTGQSSRVAKPLFYKVFTHSTLYKFYKPSRVSAVKPSDLPIALTVYSRELAHAIRFRNLARASQSWDCTGRNYRLTVMRSSALAVNWWRKQILSSVNGQTVDAFLASNPR